MLRILTPALISQLDEAAAAIAEQPGYGQVSLVIVAGRPRFVERLVRDCAEREEDPFPRREIARQGLVGA